MSCSRLSMLPSAVVNLRSTGHLTSRSPTLMSLACDAAACYLALDQGGSASRVLVFDSAGSELASSRVAVADRRPRPGWVEQDPDAVVASLRQAAEAAMAQLHPGQRTRVQVCGLSCQRSSLVCWDRHSGAALSPILSWQDTRAAE